MTLYFLDRKLLGAVTAIIAFFVLSGPLAVDQRIESEYFDSESLAGLSELSENADSDDTDSHNVLQEDLMAYYRMDYPNSPSYSLEFEDEQMVQVEDIEDVDLSSEFALSAWVHPREHDGTIFGKDNAYTFYFNNELDFYNWADSSRLECRVGNVSLKQWTHVVAVWDGDQKKIYTNGELCASESSEDFPVNNNDLGIGARPPDTDFAFNGSVYDPRMYNRSLSPAEIRDLYQGVDVDTGMVLHYSLKKAVRTATLTLLRDA